MNRTFDKKLFQIYDLCAVLSDSRQIRLSVFILIMWNSWVAKNRVHNQRDISY